VSFELGQIVSISRPSTIYTRQFKDERAVITNIYEGDPFPYEVTFASGQSLAFAPDELSSLGGDEKADDAVNHPSHYTWLPKGLEVIDITENLNFSLGNAVKYILRANHKHDEPLTDLRKAAWYINREIARLEATE
jgi:hypothetical protein